MPCPECNQELAENQVCLNCSTGQKVVDQESTEHTVAQGPGVQPLPGDRGVAPGKGAGTPQPQTQTSTNVEIKVVDSSLGGDTTTVAGILYQFNRADGSNKGDEEKSLYEFVKPLPPRTTLEYQPAEAELRRMAASLLDDHLLLISSSFTEYALDAAWEVIKAVRGSTVRSECRISFEDTISSNTEFSLQKLCEQRTDVDTETVLFVDALHSHASTFPASALGNSARVEAARQALQNSKLFLVVVINHEYAVENKLSQPNFSYRNFRYWNIPFLEPFIKSKFSDHEALLVEIAKQRESKKWEEVESNFTQQVINYFVNDRLHEVIQNGGPKDPESSAESLLKNADPVRKTVLYAATFFNEITSPEFCRVVESLLGTRTVLSDNLSGSVNGVTPGVVKIEVSLSRLWDQEKDDIFTELLVETTTSSDSTRTVSLAEFNLSEPLRKLFEKRHRFFLVDQFEALQQTGIFFSPSLRLAKTTTQLAVDLASLYPDEFDVDWIVTMVRRIRSYYADGSTDRSKPDDSMFRFLPNTHPGNFYIAFARVSEICQRFLNSPQKSVVPNSLQYLMNTKYEQEVLWLIKQLKFNAEFDDWHWLKQLLAHADAKTKYLTYYYILSYLKQMGTRVYDGLIKIKDWLPPTDRVNGSELSVFAFRILIKYCFDTIDRFKEKHYGKWPSRYSLFALSDLETIKSHIDLLAYCLLHPGVDHTLTELKIEGTRITLIGILLAEWSFILLGTPGKQPPPDLNRKDESAQDEVECCTASQMFDMLCKSFLERLDIVQRLELLKFWSQLDSALIKLSCSNKLKTEDRDELKWKRTLLQRLVSALKIASAVKPLTTGAPGSIIIGSPA